MNIKKYGCRSEEIKLKISLRSRGVKFDVFDKENNLIINFPTITGAAKYYKISNRTMGKRLNKGFIIDLFINCLIHNFYKIKIILVKWIYLYISVKNI
jgi:hypothetical protein